MDIEFLELGFVKLKNKNVWVKYYEKFNIIATKKMDGSIIARANKKISKLNDFEQLGVFCKVEYRNHVLNQLK